MTEHTDGPQQQELPLPFPEFTADVPLLPARMVNEFVYCPRLAYLEWVQGEWADSADTVQGRYGHRRVDQAQTSGRRSKDPLPAGGDAEEGERIHARSITLSSNQIGLIAKMDLVEGNGDGEVTPVDYKRGKRPHVAKGAYEPELVQLCAQGLLLEEHGYECPSGYLYFIGSRERVSVPFDAALRNQTLSAINGLRLLAAGGRIPPPLEDSPKCPRCSLVAICLPDEVNFLRRQDDQPLRPIAVARDEALPLYVQANRAKIAKKGENLEVRVEDERQALPRLIDISQVVVMGNTYITTPTLHELMRREIPVTWHSYGGWFLGHTSGLGHKNVELRTAQYRGSFDEQVCLRLARGLVRAKIVNSRVMMRRNWRSEDDNRQPLRELKRLAEQAERARSLAELLGIEGNAAAIYFGRFRCLIRRDGESDGLPFDFTTRNRRPPTDPVNAMLSYGYSLLTRTWSVTLSAVGFDPYRGFYHQPRYGRPALALDMMEPFRPLLADSAVLMAINNGEVRPSDFIAAGSGVNLTPDGRKRFIAAYERRLSQEVTHPLFGYRISYRRLLELQARLLGRFLLGELMDYPNFTTR
ncbi:MULTISPECIES: CRISPR-associated endonuclease Cas4g/Cas1g [unclassified Halorhodospira]|uniref:CRISPR-associated endonuclease Cas4g/Cas1g n=1 Tax=unclassified Halorhodospira TaxID=2626748 RepID=UPI001EE7A5E5|nr:CRISPR-associated endonuclease Cas1 [Halorhodospira sp. M39old]MCG5546097.1 CRISPR-associated endonuclease Cas1 [Halorhodospira sp. M38]